MTTLVVTADKSFANCVSDKEYESLKTGAAFSIAAGEVQPGKCRYYDTNAIKSKLDSNMKQDARNKVFYDALLDSGMKCSITDNVVTTTGSVPSNMYEVKNKPSVAQTAIDEFESQYRVGYIMSVGDATKFKSMNTTIDSYFDTSAIKKPLVSPPKQQQSRAPIIATPVGTPIVNQTQSVSSNNVMKWVIVSVVILFILLLIGGVIYAISSSTPKSQLGGSKMIKKIIKVTKLK